MFVVFMRYDWTKMLDFDCSVCLRNSLNQSCCRHHANCTLISRFLGVFRCTKFFLWQNCEKSIRYFFCDRIVVSVVPFCDRIVIKESGGGQLPSHRPPGWALHWKFIFAVQAVLCKMKHQDQRVQSVTAPTTVTRQDQRVQSVTAPTTVTRNFRNCNYPAKEHGGDKKRQRTTKETLPVLQQQAASTATWW